MDAPDPTSLARCQQAITRMLKLITLDPLSPFNTRPSRFCTSRRETRSTVSRARGDQPVGAKEAEMRRRELTSSAFTRPSGLFQCPSPDSGKYTHSQMPIQSCS